MAFAMSFSEAVQKTYSILKQILPRPDIERFLKRNIFLT